MSFFISKKFMVLILLTASLSGNLFLYNKNGQTLKSEIFYSKKDSLEKEVIRVIEESEEYLYFAIYTFTLESISSALIAAKLRGVKVVGIMDFKQSLIKQEKPLISKLRKYGIEIAIPIKEEGIMHVKMVVSEKAYASGSYNWTYSGTALNDEVLEVGKDPEEIHKYKDIFLNMLEVYKGSIYVPEEVYTP